MMVVTSARNACDFNSLSGIPTTKRVCKFWRQGRCNRNPCEFMHPPQTEKPPHDNRLQPRSKVWKKPHDNRMQPTSKVWKKDSSHPVSKKGLVDQSTLEKKVLTITRKSGLKEEVVNSTQAQLKVEKRSQPLLCKYWVTGNCVHGNECKHLHSWFCGSGFTMLAKLEGHREAITGISLPSTSNKLFSGGKDRTVRAWDCSSGQCAASVVTDSEVGCLVTEGPWLFVGLQNAVKVCNLENNSEFSLNAPCGLVCSMVVDDDKLFAGMEDGSILVWKQHPETKIPEPSAMMKEHSGAVCSLIIGANRLYSGSKDCTIKVWSMTESGKIEVIHEIKDDHGVLALCGIHDAEVRPILLCSFGDNTVRLYDLPSFTERGRIFSKSQVEVIEIGIDGLFFTGDATGEISVWKLL